MSVAVSAIGHEKGETVQKPRFETPGTLAIMLIYLGLSTAMWFLAFVYLAFRWATS